VGYSKQNKGKSQQFCGILIYMKSLNSTKSTKNPEIVEGIFSIGKNDLAYVTNKEQARIITIPSHKINTALHRDTVKVNITGKDKGEIIEVTRRAKKGFAGILTPHGDHYILTTSDRRDPEILLPKNLVTPDMFDKKVFVTIERWSSTGPIGKVEKILGPSGENDVEMIAIALEKGFDAHFPPEVEKESHALELRGITEEDINNRRDLRDIPTFTIDPEDAKDFDDALSCVDNHDDTYTVGIHIADVSYYVTRESALDKEAQERTTSVYLVDRTIPMLPEALSNNLCSLRQDEDKLTYSAIFTLDTKGKIINEWFGRTIMRSDKRFTYQEAQEVIDTGKGPFKDELLILNRLAKKYTQERMSEGALQIESAEVKFQLDDTGHPIKIEKKHRIDTNKLIEEFMLLANKRVAQFMSHKNKSSIFLYRIHDKPDPDKMQELWHYLKTLGYKVSYKNGVIPTTELNALLREVSESDAKDAIQTAVVRSMAKAIYTTENIGHYGLGFQFYTHFTSPIRRYPDVLVHRLLEQCLHNKPISREDFEFYGRMARHSSEREKDAQEAEWDSISYKQVEYMSDHVGETYKGLITGISKFGIFVRERETLAEGLVRTHDIAGDTYFIDTEKLIARGKKYGKKLHIGSNVMIKVNATNLKNCTIDYSITEVL